MLANSVVSLGNNRSNGANLGIAYINANNGLANSNGNNWRARLFQKNAIVERRRLNLAAKSETPHKAVDKVATFKFSAIFAVKDVHKRSASRAATPPKAIARWEIAA